jgi:hypothetical protein
MLWAIVPATSTARLPREIESDPRCEAIRARLTTGDRRTLPGAQVTVPVLPLGPPLTEALGTAYRLGRLVLGLDAAADALASEERGLALLAHRAGTGRATRVSRLLLLSEDGAARLNRQAERLAVLHAPRVLLALLACDAVALGLATTGRPAAVKVVLARHKETVAALLRTLAPEELPV